jgi:hypothetical protein
MEGLPVGRDQQAAEALNTAAVSAVTGYSAQQIRDLEALGVILLPNPCKQTR